MSDTKLPGPTSSAEAAVGPAKARPAKMCPIITAGAMIGQQREQSRLVGLQQPPSMPDPEAVACQGSACELFVAVADEKGQIIDGHCALALLPQGLSVIAHKIFNPPTSEA